jgi:hypothetical protein
MKFVGNMRYFNEKGGSLFCLKRVERTRKNGVLNPRIYAEIGFGLPRYNKIRINGHKEEYVEKNGLQYIAK